VNRKIRRIWSFLNRTYARVALSEKPTANVVGFERAMAVL
jgi:hypothetical protein